MYYNIISWKIQLHTSVRKVNKVCTRTYNIALWIVMDWVYKSRVSDFGSGDEYYLIGWMLVEQGFSLSFVIFFTIFDDF